MSDRVPGGCSLPGALPQDSFEAEGRLRRHWRRRNGELWDALVMGLLVTDRT